MIEVNFAAHEPMQPVRTYSKALAKQMGVTGLIGATNEDHPPVQRCLRVEFEVRGHGSSLRGRFSQRLRPRAMRRDVAIRMRLQIVDARQVVPPPHFGLPQAIEALDRVLHPMFEWRHKNGGDSQLQTQTADATHGVGMLLWALKHVIVVELGIGGPTIPLPTLEQQRQRAGRGSLRYPGIRQRAMQTLGVWVAQGAGCGVPCPAGRDATAPG